MDQTFCPICNSGTIGIKWMNDVRENKATLEDMASYYSCSLQDIAAHYAEHNINTVTDIIVKKTTDIISSPETVLEKLASMIVYMEEIVDHYGDDPDMKYERSTVDMILKVFKQMESTIMKTAELQGFTPRPTQITNIAVTEASVSERVNGILGIIKDSAICDECKLLILDELEEKGYL